MKKKHRANKRRSVFYISFHNEKLFFFLSIRKEFPFNIIDRCSLSSDDNLKPIWLTTDVRKCSFQRLFHYNTFWCYPSHIKRVSKKSFFTTILSMSYSCVKIPLVNSIDDWWTLSTCFLLERVLFAVQKVRWCELDLGFFYTCELIMSFGHSIDCIET